jgi:hypothetical protein
MDTNKYTTMTIPRELSIRLRRLAIDNGMKTNKMLERVLDNYESVNGKKLHEINVQKWEALKEEATADLKEFKEIKKKK